MKNKIEQRKTSDLYRRLPKTDLYLKTEQGIALCDQYGYGRVVSAFHELSDQIRMNIKEEKNEEAMQLLESFDRLLSAQLEKENKLHYQRVINATGVILHTNLGRAPMSEKAADGLCEMLKSYSNLEYDLMAGKRGERYAHFESLLCEITGAEAAMAVNNNAAAVMLLLNTFAKGKEVIISRGELIEIGGKFRIPDVMETSGCLLKEVGTTNKTHLSDYEDAVNEATGAILKVHTSNYRVLGFTQSVSAKELCPLKEKTGVILLEDLGSGVLTDLEAFGLAHEPTVQESIANGIDVVCFSGDKLLGGPQAGIIVGKKEYIEKIKKNPLTRALRIDKCTAYLMESVLSDYARGCFKETIPVYRYLSRSTEKLTELAEMFLSYLRQNEQGYVWKKLSLSWTITTESAPMGGGSLPLEEIESRQAALTIAGADTDGVSILAEKLRFCQVPVIARIQNNQLLFDLRCMRVEELEEAAKEILDCLREMDV